jgi:hypothetical protein
MPQRTGASQNVVPSNVCSLGCSGQPKIVRTYYMAFEMPSKSRLFEGTLTRLLPLYDAGSKIVGRATCSHSTCIHRATVQGNCQAPPADASDPPPTPGQCVISIAEDFLELSGITGQLWLDNLYIWLPPEANTPRYDSGTLVGSHGGNLYLTRVTFVGNGYECRAIDVSAGRLYARGAHSYPQLPDRPSAPIFQKSSVRPIECLSFPCHACLTHSLIPSPCLTHLLIPSPCPTSSRSLAMSHKLATMDSAQQGSLVPLTETSTWAMKNLHPQALVGVRRSVTVRCHTRVCVLQLVPPACLEQACFD